MLESGACDVLIYRRDDRCGHHIEAHADGWANDVRLSDNEPKFNCTVCGQPDAKIRPKFEPARILAARKWIPLVA